MAEEWLPAGLEYLGCESNYRPHEGGADQPGQPRKSTPARADPSRPVSECTEPAEIETVEADPDGEGPLPKAVYTQLVWHLGTLNAGD